MQVLRPTSFPIRLNSQELLYQSVVPGTFFNVGAGNADKGITYPHHHPRFTVDEDALPVGVESFVGIVLKTMCE